MAASELNNKFMYHTPTSDTIPVYEIIREECKSLAVLFDDVCPDSDEKKNAIKKIEEACMWANAAVARHS